MKAVASPREILDFWWGEAASKWWVKDPDFDREVQARFEPTLEAAIRGDLNAWREAPESCLAYIVVLDQFSRNIYRDSPRSFAQDPQALTATLEGQAKLFDRQLSKSQRIFFYLPFMHSENLKMQKRSIEAYEELGEKENLEFARQHAVIIERFKRFPHRNPILGRKSTPEEEAFLKEPGSSF